MAQLREFPDIAKSFGRLALIMDIEEKADTNTLFGFAIKKGFIDKRPTPEIIGMIKDQLKDNRQGVINCLSEDLVGRIEKFF